MEEKSSLAVGDIICKKTGKFCVVQRVTVFKYTTPTVTEKEVVYYKHLGGNQLYLAFPADFVPNPVSGEGYRVFMKLKKRSLVC
jgi:hypothetical protein